MLHVTVYNNIACYIRIIFVEGDQLDEHMFLWSPVASYHFALLLFTLHYDVHDCNLLQIKATTTTCISLKNV